MRLLIVLAFMSATLTACAAPDSPAEPQVSSPPVTTAPVAENPTPAPSSPAEETQLLSEIDAQRLLDNKGVTLQWIEWDRRGSAHVSRGEGLWTLRAVQEEASGPGELILDGVITEIGSEYFTFRGTIRIIDTPDPGRSCEDTKTWRFAVTQNRPYYRLREFEWCDYLTDYIDIYF